MFEDKMIAELNIIGAEILTLAVKNRWSTRSLVGALTVLVAYLSRKAGVSSDDAKQLLDLAFDLGLPAPEAVDRWPQPKEDEP